MQKNKSRAELFESKLTDKQKKLGKILLLSLVVLFAVAYTVKLFIFG